MHGHFGWLAQGLGSSVPALASLHPQHLFLLCSIIHGPFTKSPGRLPLLVHFPPRLRLGWKVQEAGTWSSYSCTVSGVSHSAPTSSTAITQ